jgi:ATP/maltotriose-dependent transcriptional regulator MalT
LARLRVRGKLAELREVDLRFTPEEAAELLRPALGAALSEAAVVALDDRTEGWVAGLQMAALSLQGHPDPAGFVANFSGGHRYVLDYLAAEVLDRQPAEIRAFLLETSVLERLCGPLCDAVTGHSNSQQMLERVERANLFLLPLDEVRGWWRYHRLFADLLRVRLRRDLPERLPELHRAAAGWYESVGLVDDVIRHALAAGDAVWAARLLEQHFDALLRRRELATLQRWLAALPAELVGSRPRLCLAQTHLALGRGDVNAIEPRLDAAEHALVTIAAEPYQPSVDPATSLLANVPAGIALQRAAAAHLRGDAEQTSSYARRALNELGEGEWMLASAARWYMAIGAWLGGQLREAGEPSVAAWGFYYLGQVQLAQGRLSAALVTYREALGMAAEPGGPGLLAAAPARLGMAEVAYQRDELETALGHATEGIALYRQLGYGLPLVVGLATLAGIREAHGDRAGAMGAIAEAERVGLSPAVVGLLNPIPALRSRLAVAHGEIAEAARWVQLRGLEPDDVPSYPREREYLALVRVRLAENAPDRMLGLLERLHTMAAAQGRVASMIEVRTLQALACAAAGDEHGALAALAAALTLAAPEGYVRVFVDEGAPVATLLTRLAAAQRAGQIGPLSGVPPDYLDRLIDAFARGGVPVDQQRGRLAVIPPGLVAPLSARELEVLQLVATGQSNGAIAEELFITVATVKRHVTHILDKLGATNRTQAVTRARELGLLR